MPTNPIIYLLLITILLPTLSIPVLYILPQRVNPGWITSAIGLLPIGFSTYTFIVTYQGTAFHKSWTWFTLPHHLPVQIGIYVDLCSALLLMMVSLISWMVTLYSIAYLPTSTNLKRYFSLYSLSVTTMLGLLVADNLWGILVGWELLSIASCLLIGFWYPTQHAIQTSTYTWVISQLGSVCLLIGILLMVAELGNCNLSTLAAVNTTGHLCSKLSIAGCCLVIAALTKSAQLPFYSWLPNAMAAPTPISALLHTATVLSAGVYLLVRIQPILNLELDSLLVILGHLTAFMGASAALAQQHLKRMLAYSTLSQLGYIVAAIGLGNAAIGLTYLVVHAFAKACLFLIAGNIALFLQTKGISEQKAYIISYMGGIGYRLPIAATSYLIATWGLGVIPGLIGSTAKEHILAQSFVWAHLQEEYLYYLIPSLGLVSTGLTILYMGQAFVHIFLGTPGWKNLPPISLSSRASHQNTWLLQGSMVVCASCVLLSSYLLDNWTTSTTASFAWPLQAPIGTWQSMTLIGQEKVYHMLLLIADGLSLLVILWLLISQFKSIARFAKVIPWTAWLQDKAPASHKDSLMLYKIFLNGWYLEACTTFLGRRVLACSRLAAQIEIYLMNGLLNGLAHVYIKVADVVHWLDHALMEGLGNGIAILSQQGSRLYLHLQNGRTQLYIMWTCIGMGLLVVIWTLLIE